MAPKKLKLEVTGEEINREEELAKIKADKAQNVLEMAKLRADKAARADYSGGWWSDFQAWFGQTNQYADGSIQYIGTKNDPSADVYGAPGKQFKKIPTKQFETSRNPEAEPVFTAEEADAKFQKEDDEAVQDLATKEIAGATQAAYQWRPINGFAPINGRAVSWPGDVETIRYLDSNLFKLTDGTDTNLFNANAYYKLGNRQQYYKGPALSDEFGQLARRAYDVQDTTGTDVRNELMKLNRSSGQMLTLMKELKRTGFYGERDISNIALNNQGFGPNEEFAMAQYLDYANQRFLTWEALYPQLSQMSAVGSTGGPRFRPDSEAEMISYASEISLALTGEKLSKAKLKQALENTVALQRSAFASGTGAPGTATIMEQQIPKLNPDQAASYGLGNAIKLAFEALGA